MDKQEDQDGHDRSNTPQVIDNEALSALSSRYIISHHTYSTRTSDAFEAVEKSSNEQVLLWVLRHPLNTQSEGPVQFVRRIDLIRKLSIPVPGFRYYGVDSNGRAYLATEFFEGRCLTEIEAPFSEILRRYLTAVKIIAELHENEVVLGDIGEHSFAIGDDGSLVLQAILGSFDVQASKTSVLPPMHTLHYLAPEQKAGSLGVPESDVYALGVLGYRMLTGRYLLGDNPLSFSDEEITSVAPAPSAISLELSTWVDDIIGNCLEAKPENRFNNAAELASALENALQTGKAPGGNSRWSKRTLIVKPNNVALIREDVIKGTGAGLNEQIDLNKVQTAPKAPIKTKKKSLGLKREYFLIPMICVALGFLVAGVFFLFSHGSTIRVTSVVNQITSLRSNASPAVQLLLDDLLSGKTDEPTKQMAIEKLVDIDEEAAHKTLFLMVNPEIRGDLWKTAVIALSKRLISENYTRTAAQLNKWFQILSQAPNNPQNAIIYDLLLPACDSSRSLEDRLFDLNQAYSKEPDLTLQITAALALDNAKNGEFTSVLRQFVAAKSGNQDLNSLGLGALILSDKTLSLLFDKEISGLLKDFSANDLAWSLGRLAMIESSVFYEVAQEALSRGIVPRYQAIFLRILLKSDRYSLPQNVREALVHGSQGNIAKEDIKAISGWWSLERESALLAICAVAPNSELGIYAFEALAARTPSTQPTKDFMQWIKDNYWTYRGQLFKSVGILGNTEIASQSEINFAFESLMPFATSGSLFKMIARTGNEILIKNAVDRLAAITRSEDLIPLLKHTSKDIRIITIKVLQGRNELSVLQAIYRAYEEEQDCEVVKLYNELHWVTRDRPHEGCQ